MAAVIRRHTDDGLTWFQRSLATAACQAGWGPLKRCLLTDPVVIEVMKRLLFSDLLNERCLLEGPRRTFEKGRPLALLNCSEPQPGAGQGQVKKQMLKIGLRECQRTTRWPGVPQLLQFYMPLIYSAPKISTELKSVSALTWKSCGNLPLLAFGHPDVRSKGGVYWFGFQRNTPGTIW